MSTTNEPDEARDQPRDEAADRDEAAAWDPGGTDLARAVAASFGAASFRAGGRDGRPLAGRHSPGAGNRSRSEKNRTGRQADRSARSGAGPDERDPQALDDTMDRLVYERGWTADVAVAGALARWDHIVGPEVAAHCRAERYADSELTVRADSTAWATQVRLLAPSLVRRLNEELGDGTVRRVTVVGPTTPSWRKGPRGVRDGRGPRDTYG